MNRLVRALLGLLVALFCLCALPACSQDQQLASTTLEQVPEYSGSPCVAIDDNQPSFSDEDLQAATGTEVYGSLDRLGRCTYAFANVGKETMPTGERSSISEVHPAGWKTTRYSGIDGESLYNRCHLIAWSLTAEGANERNLITGTRYLNTEGMLPYEEKVADYVDRTGNHVIYRVTPVFEGNNLIASGVHMEAYSLEDEGAGICFNIYCYDVQPGITIDYSDGSSELTGDTAYKSLTGYDSQTTPGAPTQSSSASSSSKSSSSSSDDVTGTYVLNVSSKKFHDPSCDGVADISARNRQSYTGSRQSLIDDGYEPCGRCNP